MFFQSQSQQVGSQHIGLVQTVLHQAAARLCCHLDRLRQNAKPLRPQQLLDLLGRHPIPTDALQSPSLHLQILTLLFRSTTPAEVEDKPEATSTPLPEEPVAPAEELDLEAEAEDSEPEAPAEAEEEEAEVEIEVEE